MPLTARTTTSPSTLAACGLATCLAVDPALGQSDPLSEPFPATLRLANLDGRIGFRLDGVASLDDSGRAVAGAGDVNGDGIDDFIIGAPFADSAGLERAGSTYVVFGRDAAAGGGWPATGSLADLDGVSGFRIDGVNAQDLSGVAVAAARDVNGDGIDDLIIGASDADPDGLEKAGSSYVVFGRDAAAGSVFPSVLPLAGLDGTTGFRIDGAPQRDLAGLAVAGAGDVNGDGVDDVIIGAPFADPGGRDRAGSSYVVFGRDVAAGGGFPAAIDLAGLDGATGFRMDGVETIVGSGKAVASAGDVNGDGVDDVIIGAPEARPDGRRYAGSSYVVYGKDAAAGGFPAVLRLDELDGSNGFRIDGVAERDSSGVSVSLAGDVNGDGVDDVIIGAHGADPGGRDSAGSSYVVFGRPAAAGGFPAVLALAGLDGSNGFRIDGVEASDGSGRAVASAGDVNGDGVDDVIIGAPFAAPPPGRRFNAGSSFVVFGRRASSGAGFPAALGLADLDGANGFRLDGVDVADQSGRIVAGAGDVNGDGIGDLIIGAAGADPGRRIEAGSSYVIFGRDLTLCLPDLDGNGELTIFDFLIFQNLFDAGHPRADFDGDGDFTIFDFLAFQNAFDAGCP